MNKKSLIVGIVAAVVIAAGGWWYLGNSTGSAAGLTASAESTEIKPNDMIHGDPKAKVTIIEYASMTCPHCAEFQKDIAPQIYKDYIVTGKVKLIFREYPLDGAARMASAVARCFSGDQYFAFLDLLFGNQSSWIKDFDNNGQLTREDITEGLSRMGAQAGMPRDKVESCANDTNNLATVDANWQEGMKRYGVNATPTFIVNGVKTDPMPYDGWKKLLDGLIAKS